MRRIIELRACLKFKQASICFCLAVMVFSTIQAQQKTDQPNIIFIFADDWGYGDLGAHGNDWVQTPHLDQMINEGTDFTNFTVNSPVCSPSRVAVMTGQFPARQCVHQHFAGIGSNKKRGMPDWMDAKGMSLPRAFQEAGYATAHFGKWHLGAARGAPTEDQYGYDEYATFNGSKTINISKAGSVGVDYAEAFIKKHQDKPFFINLWLHEAHLAHYPLPKFMEKFKDLDEQKQVYASIIAEGDEAVGRIINLLKKLNIDKNTLIVFSTDNGPEDWKLLIDASSEKKELYNLATDCKEEENLAQSRPEKLNELLQMLEAWKQSLPTKPREHCLSEARKNILTNKGINKVAQKVKRAANQDKKALKAIDVKADFYVSTMGSDNWSGKLAEPNALGTDGPFATLAHARDAVRELKAIHSEDILVLIRGGTYPLKETVVFGLEDSGQGESSITYSAYPEETPVFSSGVEIEGWEKVSKVLPDLPEQAQGNVMVANVSDRFLTLYDDEGMLPRAQSEAFFPEAGKNGRNRLHFPKGKLKNWSNVTDAEIIVRPHHAWIVNILPLESVDEEASIATTSLDATYAMNKLHFLKDTKNVWLENVLEELDEEGEWVLNTQEGKVYLWPRNNTPVVAPTLLELIRVEGKIDKDGPVDSPVRNLHFNGLTFKHGERYTLTQDDAGLQHDWDMLDKDNALVRFRGTENCSIKKCHFLHSGSGAIRVDLHGIGNDISGNHIEHMGGGGILLCGYGPGTKDVNKDNLVFNNHIHHIGEIYWHSPGIFLWQSGENRVANNLIHHTDYTAMIISGCMSHFFMRTGRELTRTIRQHELTHLPKEVSRQDVLPYLHTHDNVIEYNEIHHSMLRLGDGNAIYIRGSGEGNIIRRNYIHHMLGATQMQAAIRTDGGQTGTLIAENLLYKCTAQGILTKLNNKVENNIVADIIAPPRGYYLSVREGPLTGASIQRNIYYSSNDVPEFINELPPGKQGSTEDRRGRKLALVKDAVTDYNIYFCKLNHEKANARLKKNQNDGVDLHSKAVDPLFVDPENGDFRFKPGSPALKMGIIPFDVSKVGLRQIKP